MTHIPEKLSFADDSSYDLSNFKDSEKEFLQNIINRRETFSMHQMPSGSLVYNYSKRNAFDYTEEFPGNAAPNFVDWLKEKFAKVHPEDLKKILSEFNEKINRLGEFIIYTQNEMEVDLIQQVLKSFLGRDATMDDFKKITKVTRHHNQNEYTLKYEKTNLGKVFWTTDTVKFIPVNQK